MFRRANLWIPGVLSVVLASGLSYGQTKTESPHELAPGAADVRYGGHPRNVLDFYAPESEAPTPVVIHFHGGGFVAGDKRINRGRPIVRDCLANGISVVSANYRFVAGPDSEPFPGPLLDGVRVVQFVRSQAKLWNLDPDLIVLTGGSAGALMSLWIALHDDLADSESADPVARQSSRVLGVVAYAGPTTLDPRIIVEHVGGNPDIHPSVFPMFGIKKIQELDTPEMREKVIDYSPLSHVSPDDPPLQLRHGGTLASAPLPPDASFGASIHHAKFGDLLRNKYKEAGSDQAVELVCADCPDSTATEIDYLRRVFGLHTSNSEPVAQ